MTKFILASSNKNKAIELNNLLGESFEILPSKESLNVLEDGKSFQENAYKKAYAYTKNFSLPSLADDSGLIIPALPGYLGIHSARFAPQFENYSDKMNVLLEMMKDKRGDERNAYFICVLCFYLSKEEIYYFEGRVHGKIGLEKKGDKGFGYDPVFYPDGFENQSLAELYDWKLKNSHRAKACRAAKEFFSK